MTSFSGVGADLLAVASSAFSWAVDDCPSTSGRPFSRSPLACSTSTALLVGLFQSVSNIFNVSALMRSVTAAASTYIRIWLVRLYQPVTRFMPCSYQASRRSWSVLNWGFCSTAIRAVLAGPSFRFFTPSHNASALFAAALGPVKISIIANANLLDAIYDGNLPSYIASNKFALAMMDILTGPNAAANNAEALCEGVKNLKDGPAKTALMAVLQNPQFKTDQERLEAWYEQGMNRVTGWYKRTSQIRIYVLAAAVTLLINADTLKILDTLWNNPTRSALLVEHAKGDR